MSFRSNVAIPIDKNTNLLRICLKSCRGIFSFRNPCLVKAGTWFFWNRVRFWVKKSDWTPTSCAALKPDAATTLVWFAFLSLALSCFALLWTPDAAATLPEAEVGSPLSFLGRGRTLCNNCSFKTSQRCYLGPTSMESQRGQWWCHQSRHRKPPSRVRPASSLNNGSHTTLGTWIEICMWRFLPWDIIHWKLVCRLGRFY